MGSFNLFRRNRTKNKSFNDDFKTPLERIEEEIEKIRKKRYSDEIEVNPIANIPNFDEFNKFDDIYTIFPFVFNKDDTIAVKAANTINRLFRKKQLYTNRELYQSLRTLDIKPYDIECFEAFDKDVKITLLSIASMNRNGYTREEALKKLVTFNEKSVIPFIIFRLADWVKNIHKIAYKAVEDLLVDENALFFIQNHKLISWFLCVERTDLNGLYGKVIDFISNKQLDSKALKQLGEGERFFYFSSFIEVNGLSNDLITKVINDQYYLNRFLIIKHFEQVENKDFALRQLLFDKAYKLRKASIALLPAESLDTYQSILEKMIFDNFSFVRSEARRLLSLISDYDFNEQYKTALQENKYTVAAILGLSEVAYDNDLSIIKPYLKSDNAKTRSAALYATYSIDQTVGVEQAYTFLEYDTAASTRKTAQKILECEGVDFTRLRILYDKTDKIGKVIILRLFNRYSGWSVAGDYFKALLEEDEKLKNMARVNLQAWYNYTISLGIKQTEEDKRYVLKWYKKAKQNGIPVPATIPLIFGNN